MRVAHAGTRVAFDRVVEVRETQWIAKEKHRGVVAHQIPVALLGVELQGETSDVTLGIGRAALAGNGGETGEDRRLLAHLRKQASLGVARHIVGHGEGAVGAGTFGMHAPLGNDFAVEVGEFFQQPDIL
ncbi:hypothetical protein D3C85_606100 [compost metagenome]